MEQVDAVVKATGVSEPRFESFHGMSIGCIAKMRCGFRDMPLKHWHLFLDPAGSRHVHKPIHKVKKPIQKQKTTIKTGSPLANLITRQS